MSQAVLALADGTVFKGQAFGKELSVENASVGEVVFNTAMSGYQEILTDPSYAGQIMTFTCPYIGNVGCNSQDIESGKVHVQGVVVKNLSRIVSNFRAEEDLSSYLKKANVLGISGIDTRKLVKHLRDNGAQMGALAAGENINPDDLVDKAKAAGSMEGKNYVKQVTCVEPYTWNQLPWSLEDYSYLNLTEEELKGRPHVVALDCGIKYNILRLLLQAGFRVTVVPAYSSAEEIKKHSPDALFVSNGPGDPATLGEIVSTVEAFLGKVPVFGICLGHQILSQAVGGKTFKLKFGHRGGNHPVIDQGTKKVEITVQNHGFAVDAKTISEDIEVSHINLNDGTVEGIELPGHKAFCIQYHPESSPGPHDASYLFDKFYNMVVS